MVKSGRILGIDPGTKTGWCLLAEDGTALLAGTLAVPSPLGDFYGVLQATDRFAQAVRGGRPPFSPYLVPTDGDMEEGAGIADVIVIENVTLGAFAQGGGRRFRVGGTVVVQTIFTALAASFWALTTNHVLGWHLETPSVAQWYPRLRGTLLKKAAAVALLKQQAGGVVKNEHEAMAFGLARWGMFRRRAAVSVAVPS